MAYRQAKTAYYFERRGVGLLQFAEFETNLNLRLPELARNLRRNGGWFNGVGTGKMFLAPKRLVRLGDSDDITRIGHHGFHRGSHDVEVQPRLTPAPEFAIIEVVYLWRFGAILDGMLSSNVLGSRLDLRDDGLSPTRRWLFHYWPRRYQEFRTAPLEAAQRELKRGTVTVISADFERFYDSVDPTFLVGDHFLAELRREMLRHRLPSVWEDAFLEATQSLLGAYDSYRQSVGRLTGQLTPMGLPIGALTSRVVANLALAPLDAAISAKQEVACYQRYVDDFVIVGRASESSPKGFDEIIAKYIPRAHRQDGSVVLDAGALARPGSDLRLSRAKTRVHQLRGIQGEEFLAAIKKDFGTLVSERRAFLDTGFLLEDAAAQLIRAGHGDHGALRVLRDADRTKLEHFALSNALRTLERVSMLVDRSDAIKHARSTMERLGRFLEGAEDWVDNIDLAFRLLRLAVALEDWVDFRQLCDQMDAMWQSGAALRKTVSNLRYGNRLIKARAAWTSVSRYLQERRVEAICSALRLPPTESVPRAWVPRTVSEGGAELGSRALVKRARLLAAADLRARDREDDAANLPLRENANKPSEFAALDLSDSSLRERFTAIAEFVERCRQLGDAAWVMAPERLFLCTRPPSYFDIARRWLYRAESEGFEDEVFLRLLAVVNAIRGTSYRDPVGRVVDSSTVEIGESLTDDTGISRLILGNLVVDKSAFCGSATKRDGSVDGAPLLTMRRLRSLTQVLERARERARYFREPGGMSSILLLPELSVPRSWLRTIANHVVRQGDFGLVAGLEYRHDLHRPTVWNQVHAVLPGPFGSVATWPWTKQFPSREEGVRLQRMPNPVRYNDSWGDRRQRVVVRSRFGAFSVLICSEIIESRRVAELVDRVEVVLVPSWNQDTASYDHLVRSVALQLHAIVAVANNGHYSDCRAWAPRAKRWERDLCRLIERGLDDVVVVDLPLGSLRSFRDGRSIGKNTKDDGKNAPASEWQPLPPDWR